ncbi:MAG: hypothetical protein JWL59_1581 [Chthoniobacteraceae bacterium]|nr:hypothetical protein [Chthoniobacteraceae bacterium]
MLSASTSPRPPATFSSSRTNNVIAFIATTRFITISLLIHFVLIIASGSFVLFKADTSRTDFITGGDGFILTAENAPQMPKEDLIAPDVKPEAVSTPPSVAPAIGAITSTMTQTAFTMASPALGGAGIEGVAKLNAPTAGTIGLGTLGSRAGGSAMRMFGVQSKANSIVVCLDVSSSMITGEKSLQTYEVLEKEVIKVIRDLSTLARFGVVVFSKDAQTYRDVLVRATNEEKDKAVNFIKKFAPMQARNPKASVEEQEFHHGTRADRGLEIAFTMQPDVIFFVSDGEPTGTLPAQILEQVKVTQQQLPRPAIINAIAFLADGGQKFMKDLASQNLGGFREIKPKDVK